MIGVVPLLVLLAACHSWEEVQGGDLRHIAIERGSSLDGELSLRVPVEEGETALLATHDPEHGHLSVFLRLLDPDGAIYWDLDEEWEGERLKTGARYASSSTSLNWPIIGDDAPLRPGEWTVEVAVLDQAFEYDGGVPTRVDVLFKRDDDFDDGALRITLVYLGVAADDAELARAAGEAVEVWSALYAAIGIDLEVDEMAVDLDEIGLPGSGSDAIYEEIAAAVPAGTVPVVLAADVADTQNVYGVAGGIPGALVPTDRSAVLVSALTGSGPDLVFDAEEERLLGETMAHEVGHYLGLFHPVEPDWTQWDALDDTPECASQEACISQLGDNVMFPFPICTQSACAPQEALTAGQAGVANRYTGVR